MIKNFAFLLAAVLLPALSARALSSDGELTPSVPASSFAPPQVEPSAPVMPSDEAQFRHWHEEARECVSRSDYDAAEAKYSRLLAQDVPREWKRDGLLELGRMLEEKQKKKVKAAAVYEQILELFPQDTQAPDLNLRLGRIYRDLGSFKMALNRFYNVLYAALRLQNGDEYKGVALRAQLEIAHTHFAAGEYTQAAQLYSRLKLIDMSTEERRDVDFRSTYILFLSKDYAATLPVAQQFLSDYPDCSYAAEIQYLIVQSLKALGRSEEALQATLSLLRSGEKYGHAHPDVWAYWQQKTGNDLANEFYEKGDALHALTIYQTLAEISDTPEWRWPAVYEIALCFERLRYPDRALEAYKYILDRPAPATKAVAKAGDAAAPVALGANLSTLREMAQWRSDHLRWMQKTEADLYPLLGKNPGAEPPRLALNARPEPNSAAAPKVVAPEAGKALEPEKGGL